MGNYAKVENGKVTQVIVADQAFIDSGVVGTGWEFTDINTHGGVHYGPDGQPDGLPQIGYNYAGIGYDFYKEPFAYSPPQPYPSWVLDTNTYLWVPPIPYPKDGKDYVWDEKTKNWIPVTPKKTK